MMYEKNMECIKENRKYMYSHISEMDISMIPNQIDEIHSVDTKDGEKAITLKYKDREWSTK